MKRSALLRWLAGAGVLGFVVLRLDTDDFGAAIGSVDAAALIGAVALNVPLLLLAALRSHLVLTRLKHSLKPGLLLASVTLGFVAGSLTPGASGELLRADALNARGGVVLRDGLALVVFERGLSFYIMMLSGAAAGAVLLLPTIAAAVVVVAAILLAIAPAFAGTLLLLVSRVDAEANSLAGRGLNLVRRLLERLGDIANDRLLVMSWSFVTLVIFAIIACQVWLLAEGLGGGLSFLEALFVLIASQALAVVSLIPMGLGIMDGTIVGLTSRWGLSDDNALALAVLVRVASTLPLIVAAVASYLYLAMQKLAPALPDNVATGRSETQAPAISKETR
jgi:glycosyltransferase 2 family protein